MIDAAAREKYSTHTSTQNLMKLSMFMTALLVSVSSFAKNAPDAIVQLITVEYKSNPGGFATCSGSFVFRGSAVRLATAFHCFNKRGALSDIKQIKVWTKATLAVDEPIPPLDYHSNFEIDPSDVINGEKDLSKDIIYIDVKMTEQQVYDKKAWVLREAAAPPSSSTSLKALGFPDREDGPTSLDCNYKDVYSGSKGKQLRVGCNRTFTPTNMVGISGGPIVGTAEGGDEDVLYGVVTGGQNGTSDMYASTGYELAARKHKAAIGHNGSLNGRREPGFAPPTSPQSRQRTKPLAESGQDVARPGSDTAPTPAEPATRRTTTARPSGR